MGLFNKLKNVLFEDEEIVIEKEEPMKESKTEEKIEENISDRELFKAEPTFNFPQFDETEFDKNKKLNIEDTFFPIREENPKPRKVESTPSREYDYQSKEKKRTKVEPTRKRIVEDPISTDKKKFIPSPVISPVYGVLDKNYKKEDLISAKEIKPKINVDVVRKKAFGTLEEDIEKTLTSIIPKQDTKSETNPIFTDLLEESVDDTIEVPDLIEETKIEEESFNIEDILENEIETFEPRKKTEEEILDDTLENDLFDLIDSMYENREDGE